MELKRKPKALPGQALVEYVLIASLVVIAFTIALILTGPAIGNVFENTIFNLIGAEGPRDIAEGPTSFWMTVTWVATQTPQESPFPTNEPLEPTTEPTDGPTPTNTPVSPTFTPTDTPTVAASATPEDTRHEVLFDDPADSPEYYRLSSNVYLGQQAWEAAYYQDESASSGTFTLPSPPNTIVRRSLEPNDRNLVKVNSDNTPEDIGGAGFAETYFSARFTKTIFVDADDNTAPQPILVRVRNYSDGVRVWLLPETGFDTDTLEFSFADPGSCSSQGSGGNRDADSAPTVLSGAGQTSCLLLSDWDDQVDGGEHLIYRELAAPATASNDADKTSTPNAWQLYVEYYAAESDIPRLTVEVISPRVNPDDATTGAGEIDCNFGQETNTDRSNTRTNSYSSYVGGNFAAGQICYLELRGYVEVEASNTDSPYSESAPYTVAVPQFSFWNIWDLSGAPTSTISLEMGLYDPSLDVPRDNVTWNPIWSKTGNTTNYQWTREVVDLAAAGFNVGDLVTYRFRMESPGGAGTPLVWYVDDVQIGEADDLSNVYTVCDDTTNRQGCSYFWDMDDLSQAQDFRSTGRWTVTNTNARGLMSWEDDAGFEYSTESGAGGRVYYLEFNGKVNLSTTVTDPGAGSPTFGGSPDPDGDEGAPMLSFWHAYSLGDNARLEIQGNLNNDLNSNNPDDWITIATIVGTGGGGSAQRTDLHFVDIPLDVATDSDTTNVNAWANNWYRAEGVRLRFAMVVDDTALDSADLGWFIDDIYLERDGANNFTSYPLTDGAGDEVEAGDGETPEIVLERWLRGGQWGLVSDESYAGSLSWADTPFGEYTNNSNASLQLRDPIDLLGDTPTNPFGPGCDPTLVDMCLNTDSPAVDPTLSFWWRREIGNNDDFYVEISNDDGLTWTEVWSWQYETGGYFFNPAWERVEIDLFPYIPGYPDAGSVLEDDISIRFRLDARNGSGVDDGVYVDNIRLQDFDLEVWQLWDDDDGGDGQRLFDGIDSATSSLADRDSARYDGWRNRWYLGGTWGATDDYSRTGFLSIHDSPPGDDDSNPYNTDNPYNGREFAIVELEQIIDMTDIDTVSGREDTPRIYFWTRYHRVDDDARLRLQVAREDTTPALQPLESGERDLYGWEPWETVWTQDTGGIEQNSWNWIRRGASLEDYEGERIRVRFVLDATDTGNTGDGWFLDDIEITARERRIVSVPFFDEADGTGNWVLEGDWGLDIGKFRDADVGLEDGDPGWVVQNFNCHQRPANPTFCSNTQEFTDMLAEADSGGTYDLAADPPESNYYYESFLSTPLIQVAYASGELPSGAPPNAEWEEGENAARYTRSITVNEADNLYVVFYANSRAGSRAKIEPWPANVGDSTGDSGAAAPNAATAFEWNIHNQWNYNENGLTYYSNGIWLEAGQTYTLTVDHMIRDLDGNDADSDGDGMWINFTAGGQAFSFADSPQTDPTQDPVTTEGEDPVNGVPIVQFWSNASLELNGLLDLRDTEKPVLEFYTYYDHDLYSNDSGWAVEVSTDGGFSWRTDGLTNDVTIEGTLFPMSSDAVVIDDREHPNASDPWEFRRYSLESYVGQQIALRFRQFILEDRDDLNNRSDDDNFGRADGWFIEDVRIRDLIPDNPFPEIAQQPRDLIITTTDPYSLEVVATGAEPLTYQWYQGISGDLTNSTLIDPIANPSAATDTLVLDATGVTGNFRYWVRVTNTVEGALQTADSDTALVQVRPCVAIEQGDCNVYRINIGGQTLQAADGSGPAWEGDLNAPPGTNVNSSGTPGTIIRDTATNYFVAQQAPDNLFDTARWAPDGVELVYNFPVAGSPAQPEDYIVNLYFADTFSGTSNAGQREFNILLEGSQITTSTPAFTAPFDISREIGFNTGGMLTVPVTITDGVLNFSTEHVTENPTVRGIEVRPAPSSEITILQHPVDAEIRPFANATLTVVAEGDAPITYQWYQGLSGDTTTPLVGETGASVTVSGLDPANGPFFYWVQVDNAATDPPVNSSEAFIDFCDPVVGGDCNIWRINAGGATVQVPPGLDGPEWSPGGTGINTGFSTDDQNDAGNLMPLPPYITSDVYRTSADTGSDSQGDNLRWLLEVDPGNYVVRMYFNDEDSSNQGERRFDILIEGTTVASNFDIVEVAETFNSSINNGRNKVVVVDYQPISVNDRNIEIELLDPINGTRRPTLLGFEVFPLASTYSSNFLRTEPVALYEFDEGGGSTVNDTSGYLTPLNLTIANPSTTFWTDGGLSVLDFQLISGGNTNTKIYDSILASGEFTVEAWVRPLSERINPGGQPTRMVTYSEDANERNFTLGHDADGDERFSTRLRTEDRGGDNGTNNGVELFSANSSATTNLAHVVFTYNDGTSRLYVNGAQADVDTNAGFELASWENDFVFALADEIDGSRGWLGEYQHVAVYARELSASEIGTLYGTGTAPTANPNAISITEQPADQAVVIGNTATFTITATGGEPLTYTLFEGTVGSATQVGVEQTGTSGQQITFTTPAISADTTFFVQVSNALYTGGVSSDVIDVLATTADATILDQSGPQTVASGGDVDMFVLAGGIDPLTYQWYENGAAIAGATSATYTATNVTADTEFYVEVTAGNATTATSATIPVFVFDNTGLVAQYRFDEGSGDVVNDTSGFGVPLNLTIETPGDVTWTSTGLQIDNPTNIESGIDAVKLYDAITASNEITVVACVVPALTSYADDPQIIVSMNTNSGDRNFHLAQDDDDWEGRLRTNGDENNIQPGSVSVRTGDPQSVALSYTSTDSTVRLYVDGVQIGSRTGGANLSNWDVDHELTIARYDNNDRDHWLGEFRQIDIFSRDLSTAELQTLSDQCSTVASPPNIDATIITDPQNTTVATGSNVSLTVVAEGQAPLTYQWYSGDPSDFANAVAVSGATSDTLSLTNVTSSSTYFVRVTAANATTADSAAAEVTVLPTVDNTGIIARYTFEEGSGDVINDVSGFGVPLDLYIEDVADVTWLDGGLSVDVNDARIISSLTATKINNAVVDSNGVEDEFSALVCFVPDNLPPPNAVDQYIVSVNDSAGNTNWGIGIENNLNETENRIDTYISGGSEANEVDDSAPTLLTVGNTYSAGITFTSSDDVFRSYINGVQVVSSTLAGRDLSGWKDLPLTVANSEDLDRDFQGDIYDIVIYNRALTAAEIESYATFCDLEVTPPSANATILNDPASVIIQSGQTTTLTVEAAGVAPLGYQWYQGAVGNTSNPVGTNSPSYTTAALTTDTNYHVVVTAGNSTTATSNTANVRVIDNFSAGNLVVHYRFDEGSGDTINDVSGFGIPLDLTITNTASTTWTSTGLNVTANDTRMVTSVPARKVAEAVESSNELTVAACIVPTRLDHTRDPQFIVSMNNNGGNRNFLLGKDDDEWETRLRVTDNNGANRETQREPNNPDVLLNQPQLVTMTYDNATEQRRMYVNNTLIDTYTEDTDGTQTITLTSNWNFNWHLSLADAFDANDQSFLGEFREVLIYSRALSATEIADLATFCENDVADSSQVVITQQPGNGFADSGSTASLTVVATGPGPLTYQWYQGNSGNTTNEVTGQTSATLTTPSITANTNFWVRVTDAESNTVDSTTSTVYVTPVDTTNLLARYTFDEGSGATITDTIGSLNLTIVSTDRVDWTYGGLYFFEPTIAESAAATVINNAVIASNEVTAIMCVVPNDNNNDTSYAPMGSISSGSGNRNFEVVQDQSRWEVRLREGSNVNRGIQTANNTVSRNTVTSVALTHENTGSENMRLYVNGTQAGTRNTNDSLNNWATGYSVVVGGRPNTSSNVNGDNNYRGEIRHFEIYSEALSAADITALSNICTNGGY